MEGPAEGYRTLALVDNVERFGIERRRNVPVVQVEWRFWRKEDRELASFRAQPNAVFPAHGVDVLPDLAGGYQFMIDPAETEALWTRDRTRENPALHRGPNSNRCARASVGENE